VIGFEALVRWLSPQHGMIFPGEFISLAEETGIIYELGQWVLEEACRNMVEWQKRFPTDPPLSVSVNLSPRQFSDPEIKDQIARILAETGLSPQGLRIEITEGMLLDDLESTERTLIGLRDMGVQVMIDDFGTGYSSLSYLHRFPISALKIDQSFISRLDSGDPSQSGVEIVRAILALAREMNIRVVAEGIETHSQMETLRHMSCDYGQGFLISRPISKGSVEIYLRGQSSAATERPTIPISRRDTIFDYTAR
jgi:EAL domain-containing protein (putative c-di-GMP-specific phosphodiesterase class I)